MTGVFGGGRKGEGNKVMEVFVPLILMWLLCESKSIISNIVRLLRFVHVLPRPTYLRSDAVELLRTCLREEDGGFYDVNLTIYDYPLVYLIIDQTKWTRDHGRCYRVHALAGERI